MVRRAPRLDRFAAVLLAAVMAVAGTVSAATPRARPDMCTRQGHQCGQAVIACCCAGQPDGSSAPAPTTTPSSPTQLTGPDAIAQVAASAPIAPTDLEVATASALRLHSPPHGYCFVELPILLSTFLI